jgi:hypothetical protein
VLIFSYCFVFVVVPVKISEVEVIAESFDHAEADEAQISYFASSFKNKELTVISYLLNPDQIIIED